MALKQISLSIPQNLYEESKKQYEEFGYKNLQEFILDLLRRKVLFENEKRYEEIERRMKKGIGVRKFDQKGAINYLRSI